MYIYIYIYCIRGAPEQQARQGGAPGDADGDPQRAVLISYCVTLCHIIVYHSITI